MGVLEKPRLIPFLGPRRVATYILVTLGFMMMLGLFLVPGDMRERLPDLILVSQGRRRQAFQFAET